MGESTALDANIDYVLTRYRRWLLEPDEWVYEEKLTQPEARTEIGKLIRGARINELEILGAYYPPTNKFNKALNLYIDARTMKLDGLIKGVK